MSQTMSPADYLARFAGKRPSKYRNVRTVIDGIPFASKREATRYEVLKLLKRAGEVKWFIRQPSFDLPGGVKYRADFLVLWDDGHVTVEDAKGMRTDVYQLKKRQMLAVHGIEIVEV